MALARWQRSITDDAGNVLPGASVEVRRESDNGLASLFSDRAGLTPIGNPFTADGDGFAAFHVLGGAYRIAATSGTFSRTWRYVGIGTAQETDVQFVDIAKIPITPFDVSPAAVGDGVTDDTAAINAFFSAVVSSGRKGYIPAANYRCAGNVVWEFNGAPASAQGITIEGAGINRARFQMDAGATFSIRGAGTDPILYHSFRGWSVNGNVNGALFFFGGTSAQTAFNWCNVDHVFVVNSSSSGNIAVQMQFLYGCDVRMLANCNGGSTNPRNGRAFVVRACNFNQFHLFPGGATIGLDLYDSVSGTDYTTSGNVFFGGDYEVNDINVRINEQFVRMNTWIGGVITQFSAADIGIQGINGAGNRFIEVSFGGAGSLFHPTDRTGIIWINGVGPGVATPAVPATATPVTNTTGQTVAVNIYGGSPTSVAKNGATVSLTGVAVCVILEPGDTITLNYASAPAWTWFRLKT